MAIVNNNYNLTSQTKKKYLADNMEIYFGYYIFVKFQKLDHAFQIPVSIWVHVEHLVILIPVTVQIKPKEVVVKVSRTQKIIIKKER